MPLNAGRAVPGIITGILSGIEQPERLKHHSQGQRPWDEECPAIPVRSIEKLRLRNELQERYYSNSSVTIDFPGSVTSS
jgi:hypothetical protein